MTSLLLSALLFLSQTVPTTGTISGRISSVDKKPVSNIRVMAVAVPDSPTQTDNAIMSIGQTDRSGNYRLENVPPGRYYITTGLVETPTYYPGVPELASATVVTVTRGASLQRIDFNQVLPTAVKVTGRVVFANSNPAKGVPGRRVELAASGRMHYQVEAAADGSFAFQDVLPGSYYLFVHGTSKSTALKVDKDLSDVEVPITPLNSITGRIVVEGGGPIPRVTFTANDVVGPVMMPVADRTFSLTMPDGESRVGVVPGSLPAGYTVRSLTYGRTDLLKEPFRNTFLKDELVLTVRSPNVSRVTVRGRVLAEDVKVAGGHVELTSPLLAETRSAEIRGDGSFAIPGVLPGTYTAKSTIQGATTPTIVVGASDLKNVEIVVPTPSAASLDPERLLGSLSFEILDAGGRVVDRGSRSIRLKDVVMTGPSTKSLSLTDQLVLNFFDSPAEYRGEKSLFSFDVRDKNPGHFSYASFKIDGPMHATKRNTSEEVEIDVSQVAGRWEITRTEFKSDITLALGEPPVAGAPLPTPIYRIVIQKGSILMWPSSVNGKMVAN